MRMLTFTSPAPHDIEAASLALLQKKWTLLSSAFKGKGLHTSGSTICLSVL